jgi:DNA-binding response OmpR family regulator
LTFFAKDVIVNAGAYMAKKLLIVDDEKDVREFAANFFRKRKITCLLASSGEEGLEKFKQDNPDLVLLDVKMSGIDGVETLKRMREINKDAKVIMVTGTKPEREDLHSVCTALGALNYVHKPLELDELEKIVLKELAL